MICGNKFSSFLLISLFISMETKRNSAVDIAEEEENDGLSKLRDVSTDSDDPWNFELIEVEKYQEVLDESFLGKSNDSNDPEAPVPPVDHGFFLRAENMESQEEEVEVKSSLATCEHSVMSSITSSHLSSLLNSHSSLESQSVSLSVPFPPLPCSEEEQGAMLFDTPDANDTLDIDRTINVSEMLQQYRKEHEDSEPEPCAQSLSLSKDAYISEDDDEGVREDGHREEVAYLRECLLHSKEEAAALRDQARLLVDQNSRQEALIHQLTEEKTQLVGGAGKESLLASAPHGEKGNEGIAVALEHISLRLKHLKKETRETRLAQGEEVGRQEVEVETGSEEGDASHVPLTRMSDRLTELENELVPLLSLLQSRSPNSCSDNLKISLKHFAPGDIALFFPTPKGDFLAFNIGAPHHYLSEESKALIGQDDHFKKMYVLGRVVMKETLTVDQATEGVGRHPAGMQYHSLSVSSVSHQLA